ncbi:MAG: type II toxin-antitoxin system HipA family toxin [Spirochaetales bacterium]|nr:type II toxin-antitoxin system HipA family toxin [Spirochaetales bacterium]
MGKRARRSELVVCMNGETVGYWKITASGKHLFSYAAEWLTSPLRRPISLSLPLQPESIDHTGSVVENFFENLLPDNAIIRRRIQHIFGTQSIHAFDLLSEIGRDCIGAIQLLPPGFTETDVKQVKGITVSEKDIEQILLAVPSQNRLLQQPMHDFRISLAGAQEKTAFLQHGKKWKKPVGTTPSTHIFKLPLGDIGPYDLSTSIFNEWLCLNVLKEFGIPAAEAHIEQFGSQTVIIVKRFDRQWANDKKWIMRLPQEDMCQAAGISPGLKYESDGGPGIQKIMKLLLGSNAFLHDRRVFFTSQLLFWLLAAPDGHAKNFSIFLLPKGEFRLTPLYDVLSAYPVMGTGKKQIPPQKMKMAMAVFGKNRHYHWDKILPRHWFETGTAAGVSGTIVSEIIQEIKEKTRTVIDAVRNRLPDYFPGHVADSIFKGMKMAVKKLGMK